MCVTVSNLGKKLQSVTLYNLALNQSKNIFYIIYLLHRDVFTFPRKFQFGFGKI
jgi:hypothetical protein